MGDAVQQLQCVFPLPVPSHHAIGVQVNDWYFTQAGWQTVTGKCHFKTCYMVTWEEAIWTFKPWYTFDRLVSDKDPQHFCGRWPVMSAQRWDSQSKLGIAKPFYPIICMQGWTDHSDSLAKSGQDWPDRLSIRPATLPIELNIVCFTPDLLVHWSAVTGTQSQCREAKEAGQWDELQCYSPTAATFKKTGLIPCW